MQISQFMQITYDTAAAVSQTYYNHLIHQLNVQFTQLHQLTTHCTAKAVTRNLFQEGEVVRFLPSVSFLFLLPFLCPAPKWPLKSN